MNLVQNVNSSSTDAPPHNALYVPIFSGERAWYLILDNISTEQYFCRLASYFVVMDDYNHIMLELNEPSGCYLAEYACSRIINEYNSTMIVNNFPNRLVEI